MANFDYMFTMEEVDELLKNLIHVKICYECNKIIETNSMYGIFYNMEIGYLYCSKCVDIRKIATMNIYKKTNWAIRHNHSNTSDEANIPRIHTWGYESSTDL
jgi:hypothetical protein